MYMVLATIIVKTTVPPYNNYLCCFTISTKNGFWSIMWNTVWGLPQFCISNCHVLVLLYHFIFLLDFCPIYYNFSCIPIYFVNMMMKVKYVFLIKLIKTVWFTFYLSQFLCWVFGFFHTSHSDETFLFLYFIWYWLYLQI